MWSKTAEISHSYDIASMQCGALQRLNGLARRLHLLGHFFDFLFVGRVHPD